MAETTPKMFTQGQVDGLIARARRRDRDRIAELEAQVGEVDTIKSAAHSRIAELEAQVQQLAGERDAAQGEVQAIQTQQREERSARSCADAYQRAGGLADPAAVRTAMKLITMEHEPEFDDQGQLAALTVDGQRVEDVGAAMKRFLDANPYLAKAPPSGPRPTGRPNGMPVRHQPNLEDSDPVALVQEGLSRG